MVMSGLLILKYVVHDTTTYKLCKFGGCSLKNKFFRKFLFLPYEAQKSQRGTHIVLFLFILT